MTGIGGVVGSCPLDESHISLRLSFVLALDAVEGIEAKSPRGIGSVRSLDDFDEVHATERIADDDPRSHE